MSTQKKILVTGGAGYIGSHVCKSLYESGYLPITFDNLSTGFQEFVRWGPFFYGDITNPRDLEQVFLKYQPEAVMHLAASSYVRESVNNPMKYYINNCIGSLNLLEAMRCHKTKYIIFSSTCAVYGDCQVLPIDESAVQAPTSPYGKSKLFVENVLKDIEQAAQIKWVALRYFNAAGADPKGEIGEKHDPETHIIPRAIQAALGQGPALQIFGNQFNTPDGTAIRDYIHVKDLASAHLQAMKYLSEGGQSNTFNLGTGMGTSVLEILHAVEKHTGYPIPHTFVTESLGDVPALYASSARAQKYLNWMPNYSSLDNLIETALHWHQKQSNYNTIHMVDKEKDYW